MPLRTRHFWHTAGAHSFQRPGLRRCSSQVARTVLRSSLTALMVASILSVLNIVPAPTSLAMVAPRIYFYGSIPNFIKFANAGCYHPFRHPIDRGRFVGLGGLALDWVGYKHCACYGRGQRKHL